MTKPALPLEKVPFQLFAGRASQALGDTIATHCGQHLGALRVRQFSDGEWYPQFDSRVQGVHVCLVQATYPPADHLVELLLTVDAAKQAGAGYVTVIAPYLGYMRQDKVHHAGGAVGARLQARLLRAAGVDGLMTCDVHRAASLDLFNFPVQHLEAISVFLPYVQRLCLPKLTVVAPDAGAVARAQLYAQHLGARLVLCHKHRLRPGQAAVVQVQGDVCGADAVIVDDMVDTGETLYQTAVQLRAQGAHTIHAFCTHPVLSGDAYQRLAAAPLERVVVTDTIPLKHASSLLDVCSVAPLFAKALQQLV